MRPVGIAGPPSICLEQQRHWPQFWAEINQVLKTSGYRRNSRMQYRSVLRGLARFTRRPPSGVSAISIDAYLKRLACRRGSASWLAMNISILRQIFDRCCGTTFLERRSGPRRPFRLPGMLSRDDLTRLMQSAECPRDVLLLGLLYGCGLKPGEALAIRWRDLDPDQQTLRLGERSLLLPKVLLPLVGAGCAQAFPDRFVFSGARADQPLDIRSVSRIIQQTAIRAGIIRRVTAMTLRHSFAIHQLQAGVHIRELQEALGHRYLKTSMKYLALVPPEHTSPADALPELDLSPQVHLPLQAPFGSTNPLRWFLGWFKDRLFKNVRAGPLRG